VNISVFCCSTGFTAMRKADLDHPSYVDILLSKYGKPDGIWMNGLTILHIRHLISRFLRDRNTRSCIIIHVGVVEALTRPPENFLQQAVYFLNYYGYTQYFGTFVVPKMLRATKALTHNRKEYFRFLEPYQFRMILTDIAILLEGFTSIIVGMSKPVSPEYRWIGQALEFNNILMEVCEEYNLNFIDVWNLCPDQIVDSNHLTKEGHQRIFEQIQSIIERKCVG